MSETQTYTGLAMDRSEPLGNSADVFSRRALHVKIANKPSEPFPVYITDPVVPSDQVINVFDLIAGVVAGVETTIVTYTVPANKKFEISRVQFSGTNISTFFVYVNASIIATTRTMFGSNLSGEFVFNSSSGLGLEVAAGDVITLKTTHPRLYVGDFDGRIMGVLKDV